MFFRNTEILETSLTKITGIIIDQYENICNTGVRQLQL